MSDPRKGEGSIFGPAADPPPLTTTAIGRAADRLDAYRDPMPTLERIESRAVDVIREHEAEGTAVARVAGVRASYRFTLPEDQPARLRNALAILGKLADLSVELERDEPRPGWFILHGIELGECLAALGTRHLERFASHGIEWDKNGAPNRRGVPMTEQARKLFAQDAKIREVGRECGVSYRIARRWHKEFLEK